MRSMSFGYVTYTSLLQSKVGERFLKSLKQGKIEGRGTYKLTEKGFKEWDLIIVSYKIASLAPLPNESFLSRFQLASNNGDRPTHGIIQLVTKDPKYIKVIEEMSIEQEKGNPIIALDMGLKLLRILKLMWDYKDLKLNAASEKKGREFLKLLNFSIK